MTKIVTYDVMREHEGDRFYKTGETRELAETDAKHLVALGVLSLPGSGLKRSPAGTPFAQKLAAEADFADFIEKANEARRTIVAEIDKARADADGQIQSILEEVGKARSDADGKISSIVAEVEKAKVEAATKAKVEEQPANKAEPTSEKTK
jgi:hypothetical protein